MNNILKNTTFITSILLGMGNVFNSAAVNIVNGKKYFSYMVQTGESIESLANAFKVTVDELIEKNPTLKDGIKGGIIISVPVKESMMDANLPEISIIKYKVKPGDTLFSLAKNNNSTIEDIIQRNSEELSDGILRAGSTIQIAKNSGGLTGGEDKIQERKKQELLQAKQKQMALQDSLNKLKSSYWSEPWTIIDVQKPGSIDTLRSELEWRQIKRLKVIGNPNALDISVVGKRIFEFDRIKALDLHEAIGIKNITAKAFEECSSLKAIALPNSVDSIGIYTFTGCNAQLEVLRCYATTPPKVDATSLIGIDFDNCSLEVPNSALEAYKTDSIWKMFRKISSIPTSTSK